ncbi:MAG TPA: methionyl-tRNA formyltransferase [Pyrinomonadaceae bacterium]|nr:methionyl-tRNA formyltransferase [Pyrinomonadaceae bacterium]
MKILFMGTPRAAAISLERLVEDGHEIVAVYTQPDRPAGRGNKLAQSAVKEFALTHGLKVIQPTKIKTEEAWEEFKSQEADVAVVVAYGRILPERFLTAFTHGAINVHFSLLPKYRGAAPVNWAIVNGERATGVTTMKMDAGLDTGPMLIQRSTPIGEDENAIELMERLSTLGADLLIETLTNLESLKPEPQNELDATFAPLMKKEDGLISWMLDAREIAHRVRGFQPFPTAFSYFRGKKFTIFKSTPVSIEHNLTTPGAILSASGDSLIVFCGGDSMLRLEEVQLEGKRRVSARDFINGVRPEVGEVLGS